MENSDDRESLNPETDSQAESGDALERWRRFVGGPADGFFTRFLNGFSKPAGLLFLTFLLTTIIGTFANNVWQAAANERAEDQAYIDRRDAEILAARDGIKKTLLERAVASDQLIVALELKEDQKTVADLWSAYERAYHDESVAYLSGQLRLEGLTDLVHTGDSNAVITTIFWHYLDFVIQPRFDDLHRCIVDLKRAYDQGGSATEALTSGFNTCMWAWSPEDLVRSQTKAYWDQFPGIAGKTVATWSQFKTCLEVYSFQLDWNLLGQKQLSEELRKEREESDWLVHPLRAIERLRAPPQPNTWQTSFLCNVPQRLADECGDYPSSVDGQYGVDEMPTAKSCASFVK